MIASAPCRAAPSTKRRCVDFDHLGAEIGELQADHVARHQPRHVDDPHPVERTRCRWFKSFFGDAHRGRSGLSAGTQLSPCFLQRIADPQLEGSRLAGSSNPAEINHQFSA